MLISRVSVLRIFVLLRLLVLTWCASIAPLGLVPASEQGSAPPFWQDGDPRLCVLVSTYIGHGLKLTALLASLLASEYPYLDIILLDTDSVKDSKAWLMKTKEMLDNRYETPQAKSQIHISTRTRKSFRKLFPLLWDNDYGYLQSDYVMEDLLQGTMGDVTKCDYFLLTNGDNLYNVNLIPLTVKHMRAKVDLIGFDFISKNPANNEDTCVRLKPHQQMRCKFYPGSIDKGAAMFRADRYASVGMSFALRFLKPGYPYFTERSDWLDGYFFEDFSKSPKTTSVIIDSVLLMHQ